MKASEIRKLPRREQIKYFLRAMDPLEHANQTLVSTTLSYDKENYYFRIKIIIFCFFLVTILVFLGTFDWIYLPSWLLVCLGLVVSVVMSIYVIDDLLPQTTPHGSLAVIPLGLYASSLFEFMDKGPTFIAFMKLLALGIVMLPIIYFSRFDMTDWYNKRSLLKQHIKESTRFKSWENSLWELDKTDPNIVDERLAHSMKTAELLESDRLDNFSNPELEKRLDEHNKKNPLDEFSKKVKVRKTHAAS